MANDITLFETGDPGFFTSCHSISMEKLLYKGILKNLNTYNILYKHQCGFCKKKNHSTYMALLQLTDLFAIGIYFLDLLKTLNTVFQCDFALK